MKITEQELITKLKSVDIIPDPIWQQKVAADLKNLADSDVPFLDKMRKHIRYAFYFLVFPSMQPRTKVALASLTAVLVVLGGSAGLVSAANSSKPGDLLFPLDKSFENISRSLISDPKGKANFELGVLGERVNELNEQDKSGTHVEDSVTEVQEQEDRTQKAVDDANETETETELEHQNTNALETLNRVKDHVGNDNAKQHIEEVINKLENHKGKDDQNNQGEDQQGENEGKGDGNTTGTPKPTETQHQNESNSGSDGSDSGKSGKDGGHDGEPSHTPEATQTPEPTHTPEPTESGH